MENTKIVYRLILLLTLMFTMVNTSYAFTESEYIDWANNDKSYLMYLTGLNSGYMMANIKLEEKGRKKLFCQPAKLILTEQSLVNMLAKHSNEFGNDGSENVALTNIYLINTLIEMFPCAQKIE